MEGLILLTYWTRHESSHRMGVGCVSCISEQNAASIFRVKMCTVIKRCTVEFVCRPRLTRVWPGGGGGIGLTLTINHRDGLIVKCKACWIVTEQHTTLTTDSSGRGIGPLQRPLPDNTQHSPRQTDSHRDSNPQPQQASGRRPTP
jgi:hypothetical protein